MVIPEIDRSVTSAIIVYHRPLARTLEDCSVNIAYIRFNSHDDRVRGFYQLATRAAVHSLPGGVYAIPIRALDILDAQRISYRQATDGEVGTANNQARNPAPAVL